MPQKSPNAIDMLVGSRVRLRRTVLGMSQSKLGDELGVTFQQIQKYEKGVNRIGASRLQHIATVLNVPIPYFFEGSQTIANDPEAVIAPDFMNSREVIALATAFTAIENKKLRVSVLSLVKALSQGSSSEISDAPSAEV